MNDLSPRPSGDDHALATGRFGRDRPDTVNRREASVEAGYVLVMTALLLIPLLLFAAMATDVGGWYVKSDQAQRAADAAALAGTVWLPDQAKATEVAIDVAARNGFRDPSWVAINGGVANAEVTVPGFSEDGGMIVRINTEAPTYLGAIAFDGVEIGREAVAAVTPPVRMGNPTNALGTGNLHESEIGTKPDGIWLGLNGWCSDHQNGDPISVEHYGSRLSRGDTFRCGHPNSGPNPTLDLDGYTFIVDVPPNAGPVALQVFEPGVCSDNDTSDLSYSANDGPSNGPPLRFRVYRNDNTRLYHEDNLTSTPVADVTYPTTACTGGSGPQGRWYTIDTIPSTASAVGRWYLQVNAVVGTQYSSNNMFALRAQPTTSTQLCSSTTNLSCPEIYAKDWLPVWRPRFGSYFEVVNVDAEFFMANIDESYAGKTIEVKLFDAGDGMDNIKFLDPSGRSAEFTTRLANCSVGLICDNNVAWPETADEPHDNCNGDACLDVTSGRFQDQWNVVSIDLPADYQCGDECWWKVHYTPRSGGYVQDRTTWAVRIVGNPVHLTG